MIEVLESLKDLPALQEEWEKLNPRVPTLMHEWVSAAAAAFHPHDKLSIILLRTADHRVSAIAPLVHTGGSSDPTLEMIGARFLFEPNALLFRNHEALDQLMRGILAGEVPVNLDRMCLERNALDTIAGANYSRAIYFEREGESSPFVSLSDWESFEQRIHSKRRSDLRRAMRHAAKWGDVSFEIRSPAPDELSSQFEELLEIEQESWKKRHGTALSADPRYESFFRTFAELAAKKGSIRLGFMRIGGRAVAFNLSVELGEALWVLKIGYREEFSKCSPGTLLMHEMLKFACAGRLKRFEFLGTEEQWLQLWSPEARQYRNLRAFPLNWHGARRLGIAATGYLTGRARRLLTSPLYRQTRGGDA